MIRFLGILAGAAVAVAVLILVVGLPEFPDAPSQRTVSLTALPVAAGEPTEDEPAEADADGEEPVPETPPVRWYAFWSPFRSELAANGFVTQLQRTTGLDYRVVKLRPGVYEVAFAYANDAEIEARLAQIAAATGLDMPESLE